MKKTNKSASARKLEEKPSTAETITHSLETIIDAMSLINKINGYNMTFEVVASNYRQGCRGPFSVSGRRDELHVYGFQQPGGFTLRVGQGPAGTGMLK